MNLYYLPKPYNRLILFQIIVFLLINLKSNLVYAQQNDTLIIWEKDYSLSWKDFRGKRKKNDSFASAYSYLEIYLLRSYRNDEIFNNIVVSTFNRYKSFTLHYNENLLEHEQIHFNILEIFTRKIRKSFDAISKNKNHKTYDYNTIFYKYQDSLRNYQDKYDYETSFSRNKKKQKIWKLVVKKKLNELEDFSSSNFYKLKN